MAKGIKGSAAPKLDAEGKPVPRPVQKRVFHFIVDKEILASGTDTSPIVAVYTDARKLVDFMFGANASFDKAKHAHFKYEMLPQKGADEVSAPVAE